MAFNDLLVSWINDYPKIPVHRAPAFAGSRVGTLLRKTLPNELMNGIGSTGVGLRIKGSIGQSTWTQTPWLALMNPGDFVESI